MWVVGAMTLSQRPTVASLPRSSAKQHGLLKLSDKARRANGSVLELELASPNARGSNERRKMNRRIFLDFF